MYELATQHGPLVLPSPLGHVSLIRAGHQKTPLRDRHISTGKQAKATSNCGALDSELPQS